MKGNVDLLYNFYVVDRWFRIMERMDIVIAETYRMKIGFESLAHSFGLAAKSVRKFNKAIEKLEFKG